MFLSMSQSKSCSFSHVVENSTFWKHIEELDHAISLGHGDPDFLFGVATSTFQDSGAERCPHSQWSEWEKSCLVEKERSEASVDLFSLYQQKPQEVIDRLKLLSVNAYRFSVEWSQIEPEEGKFMHYPLQVYVDFCKVLRDHQIQPIVTLHHFSEPKWFHNKGSFEKEENIAYFIRFAKYVFESLVQEYKENALVEYYCTINEPGIEAHCRYVVGHFSPGKKMRFQKGARFLLNLMKAHCKLYGDLKQRALELKRPEVKIGITHQYLKFIAHNPLMKPLTSALNVYNETILRFFRTGIYSCKKPLLCHLVKDCRSLSPKVDFVGVQFYGRVYVGLKGVHPNNKPITTMHGIYEDPEGLYDAIVTVHREFGAPVLVSENGISTACDEQRARFLQRALYAAEQARKTIGEKNLIGYILWSFCDNFEWTFGWKSTFGAFAFSKQNLLSKQYKSGVKPFVDAIAAWKQSIGK